MAFCQIVENGVQTEVQAEQVMAHVRSTGSVPPDGARLMIAGPGAAGWTVVSVWDSEEARDRFFAERLAPAYESAGLSLGSIERTVFDIRTLTAGDLTAALQPA
jgi:hypothetical protein